MYINVILIQDNKS